MRVIRLLILLVWLWPFADLLADQATEEGLVIVEAKWGAGRHQAEVAEKLRKYLHNDTLEMRATLDTLGDPAFGNRKTLKVKFRYHGIEKTIECGEGGTLTLPPPSAVLSDSTFHTDQRAQFQRITDAVRPTGVAKKGLEIVQAAFGTDGMWLDVTAHVQHAVVGDKWETELHDPYQELGGDPVPGKPKHLIVGYRMDGNPKVTIFDELAGKRIPVSLPQSAGGL